MHIGILSQRWVRRFEGPQPRLLHFVPSALRGLHYNDDERSPLRLALMFSDVRGRPWTHWNATTAIVNIAHTNFINPSSSIIVAMGAMATFDFTHSAPDAVETFEDEDD